MGKFVQVKKSKYRVLISDVLPYEHPIFFTNRFLFRFLKYYGVIVEDGQLKATRNSNEEGLDVFLSFLGGRSGDKRLSYSYKIHKPGKENGRRLTIIHPFHQVQIVEFYDRYKKLLIEFCHRSNFSIRFPFKVASHQKKSNSTQHLISDNPREHEFVDGLKHFFTYKYYSNINQFYEDYRFLRSEKQFPNLMKIDLANCFECIVPENLSEALFGIPMKEATGSLANRFCQLQEDFRRPREEGIVIGPEFSRIYAEMILQSVDIRTEKRLEKEFGYRNTKDYRFYRYVDDGFLFYYDEDIKQNFKEIYQDELKSFHQIFNTDKLVDLKHRPFMEPIAVAKEDLKKLVGEMFENRLETFKGFLDTQVGRYDIPMHTDYLRFINSVRAIIATSKYTKERVSYDKISSFLLELIRNHLIKQLNDFNSLYKEYLHADYSLDLDETGINIKKNYEHSFIKFAQELTEILFFLLNSDSRMSTSIKVVAIINLLQMFVRGRYYFEDKKAFSGKFPKEEIGCLDRKITEETSNYIKNYERSTVPAMEILNVLEVQKVMAPKEQISETILLNYLAEGKDFRIETIANRLDFFSAFELMHFIKNNSTYSTINRCIICWAQNKLNQIPMNGVSSAEDVFTSVEILCCPWINEDVRYKWIKKLFLGKEKEVERFTRKQKNLFIKWRGYRLQEEIHYVNSSEVY